MVYGSVEYMNDKNKQCRHRAFPGLFAGLVYLQFWSPAVEKGGRWRRLTLGATTWTKPQLSKPRGGKNFPPTWFWQLARFVAPCVNDLRTVRTTWCNDANYNRTIITIIDNHWPPSRHRCSKLLGASTTCGKLTHPDAPHFFSSSNSKLDKRWFIFYFNWESNLLLQVDYCLNGSLITHISLLYNDAKTIREGWLYQNGWIFGKVP